MPFTTLARLVVVCLVVKRTNGIGNVKSGWQLNKQLKSASVINYLRERNVEGAFAISIFVCLLLVTGCTPLSVRSGNQNIPVQKELTQKQLEELDVQFGMTRIVERKGNIEDAQKSYEAILEVSPDYYPALHRLGVIAAGQEDLRLALSYLESAVELAPQSAELLGDIGYVYLLNGDLEQAHKSLSIAFDNAPHDQRITNNLALVTGYQGNLNEALTLFRRCNPESQALANVGYLLSQRGDYERARDYFHQSLNIDPTVRQAANGLIEVAKVIEQRESKEAASGPKEPQLQVSISNGSR